MSEEPRPGWKATRWEHKVNGIVEISPNGLWYLARVETTDPTATLRWVTNAKNGHRSGRFDSAQDAMDAVDAARGKANG